MASYYHDIMNIYSEDDQDMTVRRILAKMPNFAAKCYKHPAGRPFAYPNNSLGYVENFLAGAVKAFHRALAGTEFPITLVEFDWEKGVLVEKYAEILAKDTMAMAERRRGR